MRKFFKNLIGQYKLWRMCNEYKAYLPILGAVGDIVDKVRTEGEPRMQKIEINYDDGELQFTAMKISFWVCVGDSSPLDRLGELRQENDKLKLQLKTIKE